MTVTDTKAPPTASSWLHPFSTVVRPGDDGTASETTCCPKCNSVDTIVEYHPTVVSGFTCWDLVSGLRITGDLDPEAIDAALGTEHLCRGCLSCHYAWCETTADAG
ncbi:hypothetical protein ABZS76_33370 [Streptomyces sp. NPDC005562]|uniref:hypothetical protein n=1 Tax=Streptomyces sp. NPDC005562 TaxID=3154890 RepID=UPI0033BA8410